MRTRQFTPNSAESLNWVQKVEIKLIDREVANAQQNKMADRLGESNDFLIQSKNTKKKHKQLAKGRKVSWASKHGYDKSIEK